MNTSCFFVRPREAFPIAQYRGHEIDAPVIQKRSLHRPAEGNSINGIYLFFFYYYCTKKDYYLFYNEDWRTLVKSIDIYYKNLIYQNVNEKRRKLSEIDFLIAQYIKKKNLWRMQQRNEISYGLSKIYCKILNIACNFQGRHPIHQHQHPWHIYTK